MLELTNAFNRVFSTLDFSSSGSIFRTMSELIGNPPTPLINPAQLILSVLIHLNMQTVSQIVVQATSQAVAVAMHNLPATNPEKITATLREYKGGKDY